jgi:hypothetical protein
MHTRYRIHHKIGSEGRQMIPNKKTYKISTPTQLREI